VLSFAYLFADSDDGFFLSQSRDFGNSIVRAA
jgi:hypothetical protein